MTNLRGYVSPSHGGEAGHNGQYARTLANGSGPAGTLCFSTPLERAEPTGNDAHYCPMLAVDIKAFNDPKRGEDVQRFLRAAMYELLSNAFHASRLAWLACYHEDRGDGVLVVAPPGAPATALIDPVVDHLRAGIRLHNKMCSDLAKIRLRMSVHAGQVQFDENGVCGLAVTHLFRMLEAAAFKRAFAGSGADFALVASDALYEEVISHGPGLIDPDMYAPINIRCKETRARAWLYLPPVRNPFLRTVSSRGRRVRKADEDDTLSPVRPIAPAARGELAARLPRPRAAEPQDLPARDAVSTRDRLIAAGRAVPRPGWFPGNQANSSVVPRVRERLHPGQRVRHVGM